ncbi:MAG: hypothetical protein AAF789_07650 [Bacteroidota bacterium]
MTIKYSKHFLNKLEDLLSETAFMLRYERGNFKSGYCILNENKVAVVNKYFALEGKVNSLIEIIRSIAIDPASLSEKNRTLYYEITEKTLQF